MQTKITDLDQIVQSLDPQDKALFSRIFLASVSQGSLRPPEGMISWIQGQFGSVDAVIEQKIVRVVNLFTFEDALFNEIRSQRPIQMRNGVDLQAAAESSPDNPLEAPLENTPEDTFGRVQGRFSITASNIAKLDGFSGLVVFRNHNPLRFTREEIKDYIDVGTQWAQECHGLDHSAKYYFFLWNCLWRAGASLMHGHAQVVMTRHMHYGKVEHLRRTGLRYREEVGGNYFQDLYRAHEAVGLAFQKEGVKVLSYLTPTKEKEVILMADGLHDSLKDRVYEVLACYRDRLGVTSFNLAIHLPPIGETEEDWEGFPTMVRMVDRGAHDSRTSDMGAMEIYAASVISFDPYQLIVKLRDSLLSPSSSPHDFPAPYPYP